MAQVIYTPRNYIQIYSQIEAYLVGAGVGLTNFNVGSRIRALVEAFALVSGQTHYQFYQSFIAAIPVSLYDSLGFTRNVGIQASGSIKIGLDEAPLVNTTVPAGISINVNGNDYTTTSAGTILAGQNESNVITLQAVQYGEAQNLDIGDIDTREGSGFFIGSPGFDYAYNTSAIGGGTNEESDEDRRSRFVTYINGLTKTTVPGIITGVLAVPSVQSVYVREYYPDYGWITIYVDDGSGTIPPALLANVTKVVFGDANDPIAFPGYKAAGMRVSIVAPTIRHFDIVITMDIDQSTLANPLDIVQAAETAISNYVDSLKLGQDVIISQIVTAAENSHPDIIDVIVTGIDVDAIPVPIANFSIAPNELSKTDSVTTTYSLIPRS